LRGTRNPKEEGRAKEGKGFRKEREEAEGSRPRRDYRFLTGRKRKGGKEGSGGNNTLKTGWE